MALAKSVAEVYGASAEVSFRVLFHPVMTKPERRLSQGMLQRWWATAMWFAKAHRNRVRRFLFHDRKVPGCYVIIGNGESSSSLHNPNYDFNDDALVYGGIFARVVEQELPSKVST